MSERVPSRDDAPDSFDDELDPEVHADEFDDLDDDDPDDDDRSAGETLLRLGAALVPGVAIAIVALIVLAAIVVAIAYVVIRGWFPNDAGTSALAAVAHLGRAA